MPIRRGTPVGAAQQRGQQVRLSDVDGTQRSVSLSPLLLEKCFSTGVPHNNPCGLVAVASSTSSVPWTGGTVARGGGCSFSLCVQRCSQCCACLSASVVAGTTTAAAGVYLAFFCVWRGSWPSPLFSSRASFSSAASPLWSFFSQELLSLTCSAVVSFMSPLSPRRSSSITPWSQCAPHVLRRPESRVGTPGYFG